MKCTPANCMRNLIGWTGIDKLGDPTRPTVPGRLSATRNECEIASVADRGTADVSTNRWTAGLLALSESAFSAQQSFSHSRMTCLTLSRQADQRRPCPLTGWCDTHGLLLAATSLFSSSRKDGSMSCGASTSWTITSTPQPLRTHFSISLGLCNNKNDRGRLSAEALRHIFVSL